VVTLHATQCAWKFGVIMLVALVLVVLPGGGNALDAVLTLLTIAFLAAIAYVGYRLYHQYRVDIDTLDPNLRLALFGSIGLAILTFVATDRLFDEGGIGVLLWFALLALCSYGLYYTWTRYRSYE
jgi:drug/metabolite transporter (DMT)-like permease